MPSIAGVAVQTPFGDLKKTVAALNDGQSQPSELGGDFLARLIRLSEESLSGRKADLVLIATTKGDIDVWCEDLLAPSGRGDGGPAAIARCLGAHFGAPAFAVSAACASGTAAIGVAARWLSHRSGCVLIVGCDRLGLFIRAGFSMLGALDPNGARPFDAQRAGLCLGETAAAVALESHVGGKSFVQGWGAHMDANHLTGPSRTGEGLRRACRQALAKAGIEAPALVIAHGTGTRYNDDAESLAYATLMPQTPVVGYKGALGHSLGASGLTEFAIAAAVQAEAHAPGTIGLRAVGCAGKIRVLPPGRHAIGPGSILNANAGFGGLNAAVVIGATPPKPPTPCAIACARRVALEPDGGGLLPRLSARDVIGRVDASWGRMDAACRALVALGTRAGPLAEDCAVVLLTERGCAASDRLFETQRRQGTVDPQRFPYTLPSAAVGEASIRLRLHGAGFTLLGASDEQGRAAAADLLRDGTPQVLLARVEADAAPHLAWAEVWERSTPA